MPTKQKKHITEYKCDLCKKTYETMKDARICEKECLWDIYQGKSRKILDWVKGGGNYIAYCPLCKKKTVEYDSEFDGHRNNPGDKILDIAARYYSPFYKNFPYCLCEECNRSVGFANIIKKINILYAEYLLELSKI